MATPGGAQPDVFVSYVSENEESVSRLCTALREVGICAWRDKEGLGARGGARWKRAIRDAIRSGQRFLACFSPEYSAREVTEMNEELRIAVDELRKRSPDSDWFVPIRLSECEVPNFDIGPGETLRDLERIDMFPDWGEGMRRLVGTLLRSSETATTARRGRETPGADPVRAVKQGISAWRRAEPTIESVRAAKAQLTGALDSALEEGLRAAQTGDAAGVAKIADVFRETYEWGRDTSLGTSGQPAVDDMVTHAMPSFEAIVRLYVLGAMLAKGRMLAECRALATGHLVDTHQGRQPMARHPLWNDYLRGGGEADRTVHFHHATQIVRERDEFAVPPPAEPQDPLCQFDLLVEVHLQILDPTLGREKHCPNYAHFAGRRTKLICADPVERRGERGVLPPESASNLALALVAADRIGRQLGGVLGPWDPREDWPPVVREYLTEMDAWKYYQHHA